LFGSVSKTGQPPSPALQHTPGDSSNALFVHADAPADAQVLATHELPV
jgi:hypothetical protein